MSPRSTRRWFAAALLAVAPVAAQVTQPATPPGGQPVPPQPPATPDARIQKAFADVREVSAKLAQIEVPMNIEPAFSFRT